MDLRFGLIEEPNAADTHDLRVQPGPWCDHIARVHAYKMEFDVAKRISRAEIIFKTAWPRIAYRSGCAQAYAVCMCAVRTESVGRFIAF